MRQLSNYSRVVGYDAASVRLFGAMLSAGGQLSDSRRLLIDLTIRRLKGTGVWDKIDVLYVHAALDSVAALLNWKAPGSFTATEQSSPTFTADRGYTGNGTTSYVESNFNVSTNAVQFTQNNASLFGWCRTSAGAGTGAIIPLGWRSGSDGSQVYPRGTDDIHRYRINHGSTVNSTANITDGSGLWVVQRTASNAVDLLRNGASVHTSGGASTAVPSTTLQICRLSASNFGTQEMACSGVGASFSADQNLAFYAAMLAYMQGVGAA